MNGTNAEVFVGVDMAKTEHTPKRSRLMVSKSSADRSAPTRP